MRKITPTITLFELDPAYQPGAGFRDTELEQIQACAEYIEGAPDDAAKPALRNLVIAACNAAAQVRAVRWKYQDDFYLNSARAEGTVQQAMRMLNGSPNGPAPVDVSANGQALIGGMKQQVQKQTYDAVKDEAAQSSGAFLTALRNLETGVVGAKANADLPDAFGESETLETLARRAAAEREIMARKRPARYVRDTHAALLQAGDEQKAAWFASVALPVMTDLTCKPPRELLQRYERDSRDALQSERAIAFAWLESLEAAKRNALKESSIGRAERCFATLRDLFVEMVGASPRWLSRGQRVSAYMVDPSPKDRWDVIKPDWPARMPDAYSPPAQKLTSGAIVRQPR